MTSKRIFLKDSTAEIRYIKKDDVVVTQINFKNDGYMDFVNDCLIIFEKKVNDDDIVLFVLPKSLLINLSVTNQNVG